MIWTDNIIELATMWRRDGNSFQAIAESLDVPKSTLVYQLQHGTPSLRIRRRRRTASTVQVRQRRVRTLARKRIGHREQTKRVGTKARIAVLRAYPSPAALRRKLVDEGVRVCVSTVRNDLRTLEFVARRRPKGPVRRQGDVEQRRKFCLAHLKDRPQQIIFVDEKITNTNENGRCWEWIEPKRGERPSHRGNERFPVALHIFGMIGVGVKNLVMLPAGVTINAELYRKRCIAPYLKLLKGRRLLQDNARPHTKCLPWMKARGIAVVEGYPPRSPDMNPIERVWGILSRRVAERAPLDLEALVKVTREEWAAIPQRVIDEMCMSWPRTLQAVVDAGGATVGRHA